MIMLLIIITQIKKKQDCENKICFIGVDPEHD